MEYKPHPLANIFPLITGDEFVALKSDIKANGLREAILLLDGQILDGRNRFRACQEVGVQPAFRDYTGDSPAEFVMSMNIHRRHLDASQRAMVAAKFEPLLAEEAKARQRAVGGDKKSDDYKKSLGARLPQAIDEPKPKAKRKPKATERAAKQAGAGARYVSDAKKLERDRPDLAAQVLAGEITIPQAIRQIKEAKREAERQANRDKIQATEAALPLAKLDAQFPTIVIDPPWDWHDEGDQDQLGRARPDYHTMGIEQLLELPVGDLSMPDAHLYLWITNRSLPKGFALLERWGFRYITCLTWVKPSFGMGNYFRGQTEQVLFGVKGSLPIKRKDVGTVLQAPRGPGGHSSKPVAFLELVESCSPGPYLEMFSRSARPDWTTWGQDGVIAHAA